MLYLQYLRINSWIIIYFMWMSTLSTIESDWLRYHIFTRVTTLQNLDFCGCILDDSSWIKIHDSWEFNDSSMIFQASFTIYCPKKIWPWMIFDEIHAWSSLHWETKFQNRSCLGLFPGQLQVKYFSVQCLHLVLKRWIPESELCLTFSSLLLKRCISLSNSSNSHEE